MSVLCIADIGANHDGRYEQMVKAIEVVAASGADCAKFQWVSDPQAMARRRGRALEDGYGVIYAKYLAWPAEWHARLAAACAAYGIDYMSTVFLPSDVSVVMPYVRHAKIASFEAEDDALWRVYQQATRAWDDGRWIIVSLGMGAAWWPTRTATGLRAGRVKRLHCISSYPAPIEALRLSCLWSSWDEGGDPIDPLDGFSDHSDPSLMWTGALAVAARGVRESPTIIEAHIRLDDTDPSNPDYPHAMTPAQFSEYVSHIRFVERALGTGDRRMQPCEKLMSRYKVRREVAADLAPSCDRGAVG